MSGSLKGEQIPSPDKATDSVGFLLQGEAIISPWRPKALGVQRAGTHQ